MKRFGKFNQHYYLTALLICSTLIQLLVSSYIPFSISNDSYGYLQLANNIFNPNIAFERSIGYPILIAIAGVNVFDTLIFLVYLQSLMAITMPILIYFSLAPFGRFCQIASSVLMVSCLFFYYLSNQILTELPYMFALTFFALSLSLFYQKRTSLRAGLIAISLLIISLIRVSAELQFTCCLFAAGIHLIVDRLQRKKFDKNFIRNFSISVLIFGAFTIINSTLTDRHGSAVAPHFVFNWVYKSGTPMHYGIVHPSNGEASVKLFMEIEKIIARDPAAYKQLAKAGSKFVINLSETKDSFNTSDVDILMDDIIKNTTHDFRSWWIEGILINKLGIHQTSVLLGGAIREAIFKNPKVILLRLETVYGRIKRYIVVGVEPNVVLMPSAYFHQVPTVNNFNPSLTPGIFAEWLFGLENTIGINDEWKNKLGGYPTKYADAKKILTDDYNKIAWAHYWITASLQLFAPLWILCALGLLVSIFSHNVGLSYSIISAAIFPPIAAVFMSETDPRHLIMAFPLLIAGGTLTIRNFFDAFIKLRKFMGKSR